MGKWRARVIGGLFCLLLGCSSDSGADAACSGANCAGGPSAPPSGGSAGSGGISAGIGGGGSSAGTGGGASAALSCDGAFGPSKTVFVAGEHVIASLTITEDELELFYVDVLEGEYPINVLARATKADAFAAPVRAAGLEAVCATADYPTIDVSNDGLRMYVTCLDGSSPLRFASRSSRAASWVVAPDPVGQVADSIGVSDDELTAVAVVDLLGAPRPVLYQRASRDQSFGSAQAISGIDVDFRNPDLVANGRLLFGVLSQAPNRLAVAARTASAPTQYSAPVTTGLPEPPATTASTTSDYTPTVTPDCRTVYFLRSAMTTWTIESASR